MEAARAAGTRAFESTPKKLTDACMQALVSAWRLQYLGHKAHDTAQPRHLHSAPIHPDLPRNGAILHCAHQCIQESCLAGATRTHHSSHLSKSNQQQ